jgi:hypothetical protein
VRACGADEDEVAPWTTVFRRVYEGLMPAGGAEKSGSLIPLTSWTDRRAELG